LSKLRHKDAFFEFRPNNMLKRVFGRKFNKDMNQRKVLFRGLMRSLALNESIKTTESKAKAIRGEFESHITKAKKGEEARDHLKRGDKRNAQVKLTRAKELETELVSDRGKLKNLEMQQKKIDSAHSNLNQALLVDESAAELENIASAFEGIDLETAVDRVAEASHTLDTHDDLLSTPMFNGAAQIIDPDEVEADLAQMEAELAGENLMDLPDVPQTTTVKPDKYPVTRIQMKK
jgi:ribosomal protein L17